MYLVDTSVWVSYINGNDSPAVELLDALLLMPMAVGITDLIYMEILRKVRQPIRNYRNIFPLRSFTDFQILKAVMKKQLLFIFPVVVVE